MSFIDQAMSDTINKLDSMPLDWRTYSVDQITGGDNITEYKVTLYNADNIEVAHISIKINESTQEIVIIKEIAR